MVFLVVAIIVVAALYWFCRWAVFRRVWGNTLKAKLASVFAAWLISGTLAGFGMAKNVRFHFGAYAVYGLASLIVAALVYIYHRNKNSE